MKFVKSIRDRIRQPYRQLIIFIPSETTIMKNFSLLLFICALLASALSAPQDYDESNSASSDHEHLGRVQIKVYRGPTEHDGHEHFAPWGFWVKQPADADHH